MWQKTAARFFPFFRIDRPRVNRRKEERKQKRMVTSACASQCSSPFRVLTRSCQSVLERFHCEDVSLVNSPSLSFPQSYFFLLIWWTDSSTLSLVEDRALLWRLNQVIICSCMILIYGDFFLIFLSRRLQRGFVSIDEREHTLVNPTLLRTESFIIQNIGQDTKMRFSLDPINSSGGDSGFQQWHDAMRMVMTFFNIQ